MGFKSNRGDYPHTRMRRNRAKDFSRRLLRETKLSPDDLIYPLFVIEGLNQSEPVKSMPGVNRYSLDKLDSIMRKVQKYSIPMIALFPYISKNKKNKFGTEALNKNNLVCKSIKLIKKKYPKIGIMCDVALDPYTSHGHDGIIFNNKIDNDKTNKILVKQALIQAEMGCDVISPSDMMDGRIGEIRKALDRKNFHDVCILSYAVKYASSFYGPFRDAVGSKINLKSDKKTYQMDYRNSNEAFREVGLDIKEGADMIIVKPGMPYLDVIQNLKNTFKVPILSYQVSGEYSLIKNGIEKKILNNEAIYESLMSLKRAGSNAIITYFAVEVAEKLRS